MRRTDERTGSVTVAGTCTGPEGTAAAELRAFLRIPLPPVSQVSVREHLAPSTAMAGRHVLVVGASRGFGAALSGALADQSATVWAAYARSDEQAEKLRREFGDDRIRPLRCHATDPEQVAKVVERINAEGAGLTGLALSAAPPLRELTAHPDAVRPAVDYVRTSLELALNPLTIAGPSLTEDGWLLVVSSAALEDPPSGWGHYAAAKAAVESLAGSWARRRRLRTLVLRAPKMWTDLTNGPTGRLGAAPTERVAAAAGRWINEAPRETANTPTILRGANV